MWLQIKKVVKFLGICIFVSSIFTQSVSAFTLPNESTMSRNKISIQRLDSERSAPLNTEVIIRGYGLENWVGDMRVGPSAGWDYAYVDPNTNDVQTFTLVPTNNNRVIIKASSPNWSGFEYFNISNNGYVFLDRRANAREFVITSVALFRYEIRDVNTGQNLGIFSSEGYDYVTIGSGARAIHWSFAQLTL